MEARKFTKFKFIVRDARVLPGFGLILYILIIQGYSLLLLRYISPWANRDFGTNSRDKG